QPEVARDLETIVHKCLQKDLGRRYHSAQALADDLGRYLAGEPIAARPVGMLERGVRWCRRNPVVAALAAVVVLVVVGAFVVVSSQLRQATDALAEANRQRRERAHAQVNALCDAAPAAVPAILADLER